MLYLKTYSWTCSGVPNYRQRNYYGDVLLGAHEHEFVQVYFIESGHSKQTRSIRRPFKNSLSWKTLHHLRQSKVHSLFSVVYWMYLLFLLLLICIYIPSYALLLLSLFWLLFLSLVMLFFYVHAAAVVSDVVVAILACNVILGFCYFCMNIIVRIL